ncbi:hypothetical protein H4S02_008028, partial [Coemansia sp. RSA 2611]
AQGKHVLSTDPALLHSLLHGSDLTSPPLVFKFARACAPIDSLSIYGFRLREKHVVNDLMRWRLREIEIIGMPRKPLANLGYLLHNLRSLRSLRLESDSPLPADVWGPVAMRLPALRQLRIWAPAISASQLVHSLVTGPKQLQVLHLVGAGCDADDELVEMVVQASVSLQSLVVHGANLTARSAQAALCYGRNLTHLELMRDGSELQVAAAAHAEADPAPVVVAAELNTLSLRNLAIDDALVAAAAPVVTQLRTLHISGTPCLGGKALGELLCASTRLVALGLYDSPMLSDAALEGLAAGPSAEQLLVLQVHQCRMQSDGLERALPALTGLKHFSVVGVESVRQLFTYGFVEPATDGQGERPEIERSFKITYPSDHHFCQSDPEVAAASCEVARDIAAAEAPVPQTPRTAWNAYSARRFVPGLLAFATAGGYAGRPRSATLSVDDRAAVGETQSQRRLRSISEQPPTASPIIIHDGSDYAPSPQSEHSVTFTPMERAEFLDNAPIAENPAAEETADTSRSLDPTPDAAYETADCSSDASDSVSAAAAAAATAAALAAGVAAAAVALSADGSDKPSADLETQSVEEAIAEAVSDPIGQPGAQLLDGAVDNSQLEPVDDTAEEVIEPAAGEDGSAPTAHALVDEPTASDATGNEAAADEPATGEPLSEPADEAAARTDDAAESPAVAEETDLVEAPLDPATEPVERSVSEAIADSDSEPVEAPAEVTADAPVAESSVDLAAESVEGSAVEPIELAADPAVEELVTEAVEEPVFKPIEPTADEPAAESVDRAVGESVAKQGGDCIEDAIAGPVVEPAPEPAVESAEDTAQPVEAVVEDETAAELVDPVAECTESVDKPVSEPVAEPVPEFAAEPADDVSAEPVGSAESAKPTADEPAAKPTEEPVTETAEPADETAPVPVDESVAELNE